MKVSEDGDFELKGVKSPQQRRNEGQLTSVRNSLLKSEFALKCLRLFSKPSNAVLRRLNFCLRCVPQKKKLFLQRQSHKCIYLFIVLLIK